jgi:molecular chaperone GrpE
MAQKHRPSTRPTASPADVDAQHAPAEPAASLDGVDRAGRGGGPSPAPPAAPAAAAAAGPEDAATPEAREPRQAAEQSDRIVELEAALEAAKAEAAANWDRFLRERAEMENYKRRIERTYADLAKQGRKDLLRKVLAAVDNLERAISYEASSGQEVDAERLLTGLRLTYQQFADLLSSEGLKVVESVGAQFDPAVHEAVATEVTADKPEGEIVAEVQKGYRYGDELLRPARVRVATKG